MARTYTTEGPTRGGCGHQHQALRTALRCLLRERRACLSLGVHSDRAVVRGDGSPLSDEETDRLIALIQQSRSRRGA
jgi:hypothetical protein